MTDHQPFLDRLRDWLDISSSAQDHPDPWYHKRLLLHILKGQHLMALNLATLTDDVSKLGTDIVDLKTAVDALIALHTDPSQQAAVDALATSVTGVVSAVEAVTAAVNAVLPPPPAQPEVPAPTPAA